jgi:hypothetical protein
MSPYIPANSSAIWAFKRRARKIEGPPGQRAQQGQRYETPKPGLEVCREGQERHAHEKDNPSEEHEKERHWMDGIPTALFHDGGGENACGALRVVRNGKELGARRPTEDRGFHRKVLWQKH